MAFNWNRWFWLPCVIILAGLALRLVGIDAPLVSDELATISIWAQMPFLKIPVNYQYANNHIFHTLMVSAILKVFGINHALLRFPVLFSGLLTLILGYLTTLKITQNKHVAIGVLILLAVNINQIFYSTYARGYMLTVLFSQLSLYLILLLFHDENGEWFPASPKFIRFKFLLCLAALGFFGTWTVPTFIFFEASLFAIFGAFLLARFRSRIFHFRFPYTQIPLALLFPIAGVYIQYYVLIPSEMLKNSVPNPGVYEISQFSQDLLAFYTIPLDSYRYIFLFLAIVGMSALFKKGRNLFCLVGGLLLFPIGFAGLAATLGLLPSMPPPRVFLFLQPLFFLYVSLGALTVFQSIYEWVVKAKPYQSAEVTGVLILFYALFLPVIIASGLELKTKVFPERYSRELYHKVNEFVKQLGPQDLFLNSYDNHVWFYLYGAGEMRKRVDNIIDKNELGDIYFLEVITDGKSDISRVHKEGIDYFQFNGYNSILTERRKDGLAIPAEMFQLADQFGNFKIHKINPKYVHEVYHLKERKDYGRWQVSSGQQIGAGSVKTKFGDQPAISFQHPFIITAQKSPSSAEDLFSLNINFLCLNQFHAFKAFYFNGVAGRNQIICNPSWIPNHVVMDHPYGWRIFERKWQPMIYLTQSRSGMEFIQVDGRRLSSQGLIRGIQSYRISLPAPQKKHQQQSADE